MGTREAVLAAVGGRQLDVESLKKIGEKYGVDAVFVGDIIYSEPKTDINVGDLTKLEGGVRTEVRGDLGAPAGEIEQEAAREKVRAWEGEAASTTKRSLPISGKPTS